MQLIPLIQTLENTPLTREIVNIQGENTISYTNNTQNTITTTINDETTYTQLFKICVLADRIYINYMKTNHIVKVLLSDLTSITISDS